MIESMPFSELVVVYNNAVWSIIWKRAVAGFKVAPLAFTSLLLMLGRKLARMLGVVERVLLLAQNFKGCQRNLVTSQLIINMNTDRGVLE